MKQAPVKVLIVYRAQPGKADDGLGALAAGHLLLGAARRRTARLRGRPLPGPSRLVQNRRMSEAAVELWGFLSEDIERVREDVERILGVAFRLHESASIGPYYFAPLDAPDADLILRPNLDAGFDEDVDDPDDAFAEPDFPDFGVLLYVERKTEGKPGSGKLVALGATAQLLLVE
jgi:hypothetical protein